MNTTPSQPTNAPPLNLSFNFTFKDLYTTQGLQKLDRQFLQYLSIQPALLEQLIELRNNKPKYSKEIANFLLDISPYVEDFIAQLFSIQTELQDLRNAHNILAPLYTVKRLFIQRKSQSKYKNEAYNFNSEELKQKLCKYIETLNLDLDYILNLSNAAFNLPSMYGKFNVENFSKNLAFELK